MNANILLKLKGHERPITNILVDDNNNLISTSKDSKLIIWDKYSVSKEIICSGTIWFVNTTSSKILTGTADGFFSLYNYDGELINSYTDCGPVRFIHFDEKNNIFYILSKKLLKKESVLSILDQDLNKICDYEFEIEHNVGYFSDNRIICGGSDGSLRFLNFENGKINILTTLELHKSEITDINESNDNLITSSYDCCLKILDKSSLEHRFTFRHSTSILSFSINKNKNIIAIGGGPDKGNIAKTSDNGRFDIALVNILDGEKLFEIDSKHFGPINTIYYSEDKIITGGEDGFIHIWDCRNQWTEKFTLKYMVEESKNNILMLNQANKDCDSLPSGKQTKNKRRNLKKRIEKLEEKIKDYEKKIIEFTNTHNLNKFEILSM
jgi:WD40 repeat protein